MARRRWHHRRVEGKGALCLVSLRRPLQRALVTFSLLLASLQRPLPWRWRPLMRARVAAAVAAVCIAALLIAKTALTKTALTKTALVPRGGGDERQAE